VVSSWPETRATLPIKWRCGSPRREATLAHPSTTPLERNCEDIAPDSHIEAPKTFWPAAPIRTSLYSAGKRLGREAEILLDRWQQFIHTHHYECFKSYFQSSLAFFPRRTGERFMHRFMPSTPGEAFQEPNPIPQRFDRLEALWEWHKPLLDAENRRTETPLDAAGVKRLGDRHG
jgi:hypothetical protein